MDKEQLVDPCTDCSHKGTRGEPCLSCAKRILYNAAVEQLNCEINEASVRTHDILVIKSKRSFDVAENDDSKVELNEGYEFTVNAAIPEVADGIAKMAIEMDKMKELGENAGMMFLTLCAEFYKKLREGGNT